MNWYHLIRPALFALNPEVAHDVTLMLLRAMQRFTLPKVTLPPLAPVKCFGLTFPNPIGLAAGLDKNAECIPVWQALGFGFIEIGTVTPRPQAGNVKPRLFRLKPDGALINRMGFNNKGVDYIVDRLKITSRNCPLGANIGKNKDTSLERAKEDYLQCLKKLAPFVDYITINVSSPNTPGLRNLQDAELLTELLQPLLYEAQRFSDQTGKALPMLVKLAPDLAVNELQQLALRLVSLKVAGVIVTNTTLARPAHLLSSYAQEAGGLSGAPLGESSTHAVRIIHQEVGEALPIIAVGGIMHADQAIEKLQAGATLVQLYTGLIYEGPVLIKDIAVRLSNLR